MDVPDYGRGIADLAKSGRKWKLGIPKEYFGEGLDPEVGAAVQAAIDEYRQARLRDPARSRCRTRSTRSAPTTSSRPPSARRTSPATTACATATARRTPRTPLDIYFKSRAEGFGAEVKRRIILGTYVLSSGYYDAYYLRAQKVRTLIRRDFLEAYKEVDAIVTPTSPTPAFRRARRPPTRWRCT